MVTGFASPIVTGSSLTVAPLDNSGAPKAQPFGIRSADINLFDEDPLKLVYETPKREPFAIPDDAPELPFFMAGNELSYIEDLDKQDYTSENHHEPVETLEMANLISSKMKNSTKHKVILDLDFDAWLVDSSTPGHKHLYLDKELTKDQMDELLRTLHNVGIIAQGNLNQWDRFKAVFLRLPWIKKGPDATDDNDNPKD